MPKGLRRRYGLRHLHFITCSCYRLAAALLRFQRLESSEVRRETPIHAHESVEKETGRTSPRLALEQFFLLREEGIRVGSHRSPELIWAWGSVKSPALQKAKDGAPKVQLQRPGHPPEKKVGRSSEGLALEQLFLLLETRKWLDPRRSSPLARPPAVQTQPLRPFENHEGTATRKFKTVSKRGPPARWDTTRHNFRG